MTEAPDHCYDVCVVGGGLGGLALAVALEQLGLDWQLCEAAEELR
jgi:2-polyprenyl-6-methoxyphenol hydroxylase-like FAD-dependent oxidoreductase